MFHRLLAVIVLFAVALPGGAGDKPKGAPLVRLPGERAEMRLTLPAPAQKCANWAWAVGVEAILQAQHVSLKQNFWVQKVNGGEVCVDAPAVPEALTHAIDGRYVLDDGRKVQLQSRYIAGPPTIPDELIAPIRQGVPVLLFWNGRALVVRAVIYDEYIYPNGQRMFEIREIKLVDALAAAKEREVSFVNGRDDPAEISGVLQISVIPDQPMRW